MKKFLATVAIVGLLFCTISCGKSEEEKAMDAYNDALEAYSDAAEDVTGAVQDTVDALSDIDLNF